MAFRPYIAQAIIHRAQDVRHVLMAFTSYSVLQATLMIKILYSGMKGSNFETAFFFGDMF